MRRVADNSRYVTMNCCIISTAKNLSAPRRPRGSPIFSFFLFSFFSFFFSFFLHFSLLFKVVKRRDDRYRCIYKTAAARFVGL